MQITTAEFTDPGGRDTNEDRLGVARHGPWLCCVLADGAGGHGGGDVAARIVVDTVLDGFARLAAAGTALAPSALTRLLLHANDAVMEAQDSGQGSPQMRSTSVVLLVDTVHHQACWANCGDSRLYCLRNGQVLAQSRDHSLVQGMVDAGLLAADDVRRHPRRNVLLSALGAQEGLEIAASPGLLDLHEGDCFLLCSDGLWEAVDEAAIGHAVWHADSAHDWLTTLAAAVRTHSKPGHDNYTGIAVWVGQVHEVTRMGR